MSLSNHQLEKLAKELAGDLFYEESYRLLYATDASAYRELPAAVARPVSIDDLKKLIHFARENNTSLIPRTAGTSLAGQVVGNGIVADVSKYMTRILEINKEEHWVRVEPGVVLDELNKVLAESGLFFGPETSTSNRCMMGGMVGNNSCGAHSLIYGSTREHTLEVEVILSDGSEVLFKALSNEEFLAKCEGDALENALYRNVFNILSDENNQENIRKEFPNPEIERRNTGYALDLLLDTSPFNPDKDSFNFTKLIAGSEGTLAFITSIKLNLVPVPPKEKVLVCVHYNTLEEALEGNLIALEHKPGAIELMDDMILELTKGNISQNKNRFFLKGNPAAVLLIEFARENRKELDAVSSALIEDMKKRKSGYHFPVIYGDDIPKVWALRKAGLGVLSNMPGDAKPVAVIEDTAIHPRDLLQYIKEYKVILDKYGLECVYYAHIATGELHLRPVLNLKDPEHVELFYTIAREIALLVKKFNGSLSGEHGDGRLRGEFIPLMVGEKNYELFREIKETWDPQHIFNPGKIVDTPSMKTYLRYEPGQETRDIITYFDFSGDQGIIRAIEKCNGSGDCRKTAIIGGTMCPSFMATRDEQNTTRARANTLREFLTYSSKKNPFDHKEIYDVLDLCLSCKGCKSECPSNIDITKYKAEFLQHYYDDHGVPLRTRAIAYISSLNKLGSIWPAAFNFFSGNILSAGLIKAILGFAQKRSIPRLNKTTLRKWAKKELHYLNSEGKKKGRVFIFADEFTEYNDTQIGIKAIKLLANLGYEILIPDHIESGRTFLSKGLVKKAKQVAVKNVNLLSELITADNPLIGIEPSAILTFRDEYPELVGEDLKLAATELAENCLMFDEFIVRERDKGNIDPELFTKETQKIKLHGHCHQKSLSSTGPSKDMLSIPENYSVVEIKSGCCGMAGSFGYEKEHFELSMKVGELVLFPEVREAGKEIVISAPGTSCRHQIKDGTGKEALHPVEVLYGALINQS